MIKITLKVLNQYIASNASLFLFVELRFHYHFISPISYDMKLVSRFEIRWVLRSAETFTPEVWHTRHTQKQKDEFHYLSYS